MANLDDTGAARRRAREAVHRSRADVAQQVGISAEALRRYEMPRGEKGAREPDGPTLLAMSKLYGVSLEYLVSPGAATPPDGVPHGTPVGPSAHRRESRDSDYYRGILRAAQRVNALAAELMQEAAGALDDSSRCE